ncbi:dihydrodipicolinate synthase family protein [Xanthobacteraceae bacterium Astr-EGSB]|uniref:dihydrodipicolinate synthase family protein n=1 Tax=Astrobacterium formosum TaxID=3069710 RepID=UPI0027B4FE4A|nr:dihydrodipicolinate synthase family protein [Xanthobacteraceae bacterium Astr-EGSB]
MACANIEGMIPPVVVPFTADGEIDEKAFRTDLRYLIKAGVHGMSCGGSTGEGAVLSDHELRRCLEIVMEERPAGMPVLAGVIRNSTLEVLRCAKTAKELGVDGLLVTPAFYFGSTFAGNFQFFETIGKETRLPIIVYNVVPTNVIGSDDFVKLLEIEEVFGIKQVDPVKHAETSVLCASVDKARIYSACDQLLYGTYVSGSAGAISALVTVAPAMCVQQWNAFKAGDQKTAMDIQRKLLPVVRAYSNRPYPGKVKALLDLQGRKVGMARLPSVMPTGEELEAMKAALKYAGLT